MMLSDRMRDIVGIDYDDYDVKNTNIWEWITEVVQLEIEWVDLQKELKNLYLLLDVEGHLGKDGYKRLEEIKKALEGEPD